MRTESQSLQAPMIQQLFTLLTSVTWCCKYSYFWVLLSILENNFDYIQMSAYGDRTGSFKFMGIVPTHSSWEGQLLLEKG